VAARYHAGLAGTPGLTTRPLPHGVASNHYKYVAFLDDDLDRDVLKKDLRSRHGVALSGEVYARPLHLEPVFSTLPHPDLAGAESVCRRHVCLPLHSDMTDDEADHVVASVKAVVDHHD
jgi:dTDP-4-amino-4,6-dideoxygalactose transaminase